MFPIKIVLLVSALALIAAGCRTQEQPAVVAVETSALDVPIESIAASARGCAILDKDFPGLRSHAMYGFFKSMSLHQIAAMSKGRMTPAMMAQAKSDLSALTFVAARGSADDLDPMPKQATRSRPE